MATRKTKQIQSTEEINVDEQSTDEQSADDASTDVIELDVLNSPMVRKIDEKPNIKFIGKDSEPLTRFTSGMRNIKLPDQDEQRAGFYHEHANVIIAEFPELYKPIVEKG